MARSWPLQANGKAFRTASPPVVYIVDADERIRQSLELLLRPSYRVRSFACASAFFQGHDPECPGCIILDVAVPESDGLAVQAKLAAGGCLQPLIFLSATSNIPLAVRALRAGAFNVLARPAGAEDIHASLRDALSIEAARRHSRDSRRAAANRLATLTRRERQVLRCVVNGRLNKQIAADLGIVENTVKAHRARVMQKLAVRSIADLVAFALLHDLTSPASGSSELRDCFSERNCRFGGDAS
jgi:FixJ family two-component response regulator